MQTVVLPFCLIFNNVNTFNDEDLFVCFLQFHLGVNHGLKTLPLVIT